MNCDCVTEGSCCLLVVVFLAVNSTSASYSPRPWGRKGKSDTISSESVVNWEGEIGRRLWGWILPIYLNWSFSVLFYNCFLILILFMKINHFLNQCNQDSGSQSGVIIIVTKGDNRGWDSWIASPTQWTWVWANSGRWWGTGKPGVWQSMGSQRVGHGLNTEQQQQQKSDVRIPCHFLIF